MKIRHENVQPIPRLPFKYYEHDPLTSIAVAPHWHQGIELNYLVAGATLKVVTDGKTTEYHPGDLWAINRRVVHSTTGIATANWREFGLIIDDDFLQTQLPASENWQLALNGPLAEKEHPAAYAAIQQDLMTIHDNLTTGLTDLSRLTILSHFYDLLHALATAFNRPTNPNAINPNLNLVDQVMTQINHDYAQPITGATLAATYHVSLTTLNQQFNTNLQLSVNRYLRLIRLMNARRLLLETDRKIDYIAASCGFSNRKTLNRNFQTWKGCTPTAYRQAYTKYHQIDANCL
ncbi:AraC family transcriptional regulator [Lactobacillus sp. CBA3605]|uniref:AraC family transcriptional regulator n=1 Tax=Lactobacillus sp. CBA3605 TaxID=2099788 RepID=UPI000CFCA6D4|nr:AraC family transcriptional regulator [Lactobacillus sp. CBA3605]AVK61188.1 AraC family transcriptional regulator [Lactobacillus sp. CBA3605]